MGNYEAYIYTLDEDNNEIGTIMKVRTSEKPADEPIDQEPSENNNPEATESNLDPSAHGNSIIGAATTDQSSISTDKGTSTNNQAIKTGSNHTAVLLICFVVIGAFILFIYIKRKVSQ